MKYAASPFLFYSCCTIFLLHQAAEKIFHLHFVVADHYLDPLLFMPILLTLYAREKRLFHPPPPALSFTEIILLTMIAAFAAEIIFPRVNPLCKADWLDVLAYCIGSCVFVLCAHKNLLHNDRN